jgi:HEAT repeat protein
MKHVFAVLYFAGALAAAADPVEHMLNEKLTPAQRNDACFALRGDRSPHVVAAMRSTLANDVVRSCAARNLREAGAVDELKNALAAPQAEVRAVAARELGAFGREDLVPLLVKTAHDPNLLVASNAVMALGQYRPAAVLPYLLDLAGGGGAAGLSALSRAAQFDEKAALPVSRVLLRGSDLPVKMIALKVVGDCGDPTDLPGLREIAARGEPLTVRSRGFGLMPALDLSRAAKHAIDEIERRQPSKSAG